MKSLGLALALLAAPAAQAAVTPGDLIVTAGAARYSLSSGASKLAMLDDSSRAVFTQALALDNPDCAALWGRLLTGAVQIRRENGDQADTLWFNPLFDGGIVAHWTRAGGQWRAVTVTPVNGTTLRGETPVDLRHPAWLRQGGDMGRSLGDAAGASFADADRLDWARLYAAPGTVNAVLSSPYEGNRGLYRMMATPGYEHALDLIDRLMVTGDPAALKLPASMRRGLASYGDDARRTLSPVAAYRRSDGWTLAMQSPEAPQIVWLIHFVDPKGSDPALPRGFVAVGTGPAAKETAQ